MAPRELARESEGFISYWASHSAVFGVHVACVETLKLRHPGSMGAALPNCTTTCKEGSL